MHDVMTGHVQRGLVPGILTLVSRRGEVHVDAIGTKEFGGSDPMRRDTIFRIASVTKPIVATAAMILVEECTLRLDEPVDPWLPELADRRVLRAIESPLDDSVPASRPITLRDLLTFRLGIGSVMVFPPRYPIQQAMAEAGVASGPTLPAHAPDELMRRFGSLPLVHQPGERWLYDSGSDILGVLISRVADTRLEEFLQVRIFEPLGMSDTSFRTLSTFGASKRCGEHYRALTRVSERIAIPEWLILLRSTYRIYCPQATRLAYLRSSTKPMKPSRQAISTQPASYSTKL